MNTVTEPASSGGKRNRQLWLIVAIAALTTIIPYIMYYTGIGIPKGTTNEGILVANPVVMTDFSFRDRNGRPWVLGEQTPKFRLMIPVRGDCDEACRNTLYITRQVDTRLSDKSEQLQRIYVQLGAPDSEEFMQMLQQDYPDLVYLRGDYRQWRDALQGQPELTADFDGHEYYLLHRYGALAMAYNQQHSGNQLLDDLEFLIRTSN